MDPDVDGQGMRLGRRLQTLDEWGAGGGQAERYGLAGGRGDVVGCFGEEERLYEKKGLCKETIVNGGA